MLTQNGSVIKIKYKTIQSLGEITSYLWLVNKSLNVRSDLEHIMVTETGQIYPPQKKYCTISPMAWILRNSNKTKKKWSNYRDSSSEMELRRKWLVQAKANNNEYDGQVKRLINNMNTTVFKCFALRIAKRGRRDGSVVS